MDKVWMVFWTFEDRITGDLEHGALGSAFRFADVAEQYAMNFFLMDAVATFHDVSETDLVLYESDPPVVPSEEFPAYLTELMTHSSERLFVGCIAGWKHEVVPVEWMFQIREVEVVE